MNADAIHPQAWLAAHPLGPNEQLYTVFGSASSADPWGAWCRLAGVQTAQPIWDGTPYAGWKPVMPYLARLSADSDFLGWCADTEARDWGWLAVSSHDPDALLAHLQSLTQVLMPRGDRVFFRFWDGHYLLPTLDHPSPAQEQPFGVFSRFWINGQVRNGGEAPLPAPQPFPWWRVPEALVSGLLRHDLAPVVGNLLQWLREQHPDQYFALPEPTLQHKVEHFVRGTVMDEHTAARLLAHLQKDLSR